MKRTFVVLIAALLILIIAACGQEPVTIVVTATPEPATATPVPSTETPDTSGTSDSEAGTEAEQSSEPAEPAIELPEEMNPSPDAPGPEASAGRVAFMGPYSNNFQVFVMNADGSGLRMLSDGITESIFPSLSPDGTKVAFAQQAGQSDLNIVVADVESGEVTPLTDGPELDNQPVWSPDGTQIGFVSNREDTFGIFVMDADGGNVRRVTDLGTEALSPLGSWSPDGTQIIFGAEQSDGSMSIQTADVESGEVTTLTTHNGEEANPVFSPSGERVAFHSDRGGPQNLEILVMDADGDNVTALTNVPGPVIFPTWAPDGEWVAFTMIDASQTLTLNQIPIDGGPVRRLQGPNGDALEGIITSWVATDESLADTDFSQTPQFEVSEELIADAPSKGDPDAPVTIIEFSDYECPFCKRFVDDTMGQLEQYIEDGTVRLVWIDFPLTDIHPQAQKAAIAARCAADQEGNEAFWDMHDVLFDAQDRWGGADTDATSVFVELADEIGLDGDELQSCVEAEEYSDIVQAGLQEGQRLGVTGTPTFFINGEQLVGAQPIQAFEEVIARKLQEAE